MKLRLLRNCGLAAVVLLALVVLLGGQGPPFPYVVNLAWVDSSTSGTTGQNVYRATYAASVCGPYAILAAGANISPSLTAFTDSTVANGGSYCYALTAIAGNGKESAQDLNSNNPVLIPAAPPTGLSATVQ
jgi:hypothetical protein